MTSNKIFQKVKEYLISSISLLLLYFKIGNAEKAILLNALGIGRSSLSPTNDPDCFYVKQFGIEVNLNQQFFIFEWFQTIREMMGHCNLKLISEPGSGIIFDMKPYRFNIQHYEEIFIFKEIFLDQVYDIELPEESVVIDIGMNIGLASLYFANKANVLSVKGFEPFIGSFNRALQNIQLNKHLEDKIDIFNYGLSQKDENVTEEYNSGYKGIASTSGLLSEKIQRWNLKETFIMEEVRLRSSADVVREIIDEYPNTSIVIKMDCEGAEYNILEHLSTSNILPNIHAIILEWHYKGSKRILEILKSHKFYSFLRDDRKRNAGVIYAVNQQPI